VQIYLIERLKLSIIQYSKPLFLTLLLEVFPEEFLNFLDLPTWNVVLDELSLLSYIEFLLVYCLLLIVSVIFDKAVEYYLLRHLSVETLVLDDLHKQDMRLLCHYSYVNCVELAIHAVVVEYV
jgi:hypothetical protein